MTERSDGKTVVVAHDNELNRFMFEEAGRREGVEVVFFRERRNPLVALLKLVRMAAGNPRGLFSRFILPDGLRSRLAATRPCDTLLLWSLENFKYVAVCAADSHAGRMVSWLWNPMKRLSASQRRRAEYVAGMNELGVELATFDPGDAAMLEARLLPQVHRRLASLAGSGNDSGRGAFFVGRPKGRGEILTRIEGMLADAGVECNFYLTTGGDGKEADGVPENLSRFLHTDLLSYSEVLRRTASAACVLDIVQPGQLGVTLRSLEALFYSRKLITNNPAIKSQDFYRPENMWVLDDPEEKRSLAEFLSIPFRPVPEEIISRHLILPWLGRI